MRKVDCNKVGELMKIFQRTLILGLVILLISCAPVFEILNQLDLPAKLALTEEDVANGLKEALKVGANNSVDILSLQDGFIRDELLKIALPEEAKIITDNLSLIPGGQGLLDDVVLRLNRAAEDAINPTAIYLYIFRQHI